MCQIWDGNPLTSYAVVFLKIAGFNELQAFNLNMGVNACFVAGPLICYGLFPFFGRRTIYMSGLFGMLLTLVAVSQVNCSQPLLLTFLDRRLGLQ